MSLASRIRRDIDAVRGEIGRNVTFHVPKKEECSICVASGYYDAASDSSFYETCPICVGAYYTDTTEETTVLARVRFANDEQITATPAGKYFAGDATIHVEPEYLNLAESAQVEGGKVVVDDHDMQIQKIIPLGTIETNRIRLVLINSGKRPQ